MCWFKGPSPKEWDFKLELGRDQCQALRHKHGAWQSNALSSEFSPRLGFEEPPPPPYRVQGSACRSSMGSGDHMEGRHSGRCSPVDEHCGRFTLPCVLYRLTALLFLILFLPHQFSFCHSSRRTSALPNLTSMLCPATNYWTYFALFPKRRN